MRSLQTKLGSGLFLSLIICFSAFWYLVSINIEEVVEDYISSRIKHDMDSLLTIISIDEKANLVIDNARIDLLYKQPFSGHYYLINSSSQQIHSRSLWDHSLEPIILNAGEYQNSYQAGPQQQELLVVSAAYTKQNKHFTLSVAENFQPIKNNLAIFKLWFAIMAFCLLVVLLILQIIILKHSLKPLRTSTTEIKLLEQGQITKLSANVPEELQPFIHEVNHLLTLVEQRISRSRNASSDLAHAIKKPLTVISQIVNGQTKTNAPATKDNDEIILQQTDIIYQITDRILKRSRLAGQAYKGSLFSFTEDLPALIKTLDMMYMNKNLSLVTHITDEIKCAIDREDMLELLGNILDNAYKWSKQSIIISVSNTSLLHIRVEDDGPGAKAKQISQLAKRGVRLDEQIEGHGFGLAIVSDIVKDYNGSCQFGSSKKLGGFQVEIKLPETKYTAPRID
ncbi:MAG: sensor histidine kinase [Gammaproteobacteria bacterium]|nr:sensor histidine kinase [Gammaproteobacteria bacterium]